MKQPRVWLLGQATAARALLFVALTLGTLQVPSNARAAGEETEALLKQAEKQYEQLEYEQALKTLIQVQQAPDLTPIQRARTYLYMGVAFTALGRAENAVQAFMEVLKLRPNFRLPPGVSPSIRAMFGQALKRLQLPETAPEGQAPADTGPTAETPPPAGGAGAAQPPTTSSEVDVAARVPHKVLAGQPIPIQIEIDDQQRKVREIVIRWRRKRDPDFSTIRITYAPGATKAKGIIPGAAIGDDKGHVLFYVEARDSEGAALASAGDEETPRRVALTVKETQEDEGSNWHWWALGIGGGAALLAGGILAAMLATGGSDDLAPLSVVIR
jgi:tetratricopeptide (TPR) repeat protein